MTLIANIARQYQELTDKAINVANTYGRMARERVNNLSKQLERKEHTWYERNDSYNELAYVFRVNPRGGSNPYDQMTELGETTFTCGYEYNDACNCHPEYQQWTASFPNEWLELDGDDLTKTITKRLDECEAGYYTSQKAKAEKKATEEAEKKAKAEQQERKNYERLKAKYGN